MNKNIVPFLFIEYPHLPTTPFSKDFNTPFSEVLKVQKKKKKKKE